MSSSDEGAKVVRDAHAAAREDDASLNPIPRAARFNEDKRMDEVTRMLQYVEPVVIAPGERTL